MKNMRIAQKLIVSFLIMAVIACIIGVVGIVGNLSIKKADNTLYEEDTRGMQYAGNAAVTFMQIRYNSLRRLYGADQKAIDDAVKLMSENFNQMDEHLVKCHETIKAPDIKELLDRIQKNWDFYRPVMNEDNQVAVRGEKTEMNMALVQAGTELRDDFLLLFEKVAVQAGDKADDNAAKAQTTVIIVSIVIVAGLAMSVLLGVYLSRIIGKPLRMMSEVAKKLAVGDINVTINVTSKDEIGELADAFRLLVDSTKEQVSVTRKIAEGDLTTEITVRSEEDVLGKALIDVTKNLNELVVSIVSSADQVASSSSLVSESSIALSQGATEQASSVQELTASLDMISEQTSLNAQNAHKANELAVNAKQNAEKGNTHMKEMLSAMEEINISSTNISKIIKVIDDIAFQTNILALNAAVEAARAGQHGKGFAVVAEEVRTLAAKSANAASETTDMIESSIRKVDAGTKIANETAGALNQIVDEVSKAADLVGSIANASQEQKSSIGQINEGIQQVSKVVQTNAATSEESAAASEELSSQAEQMKETISVFKLRRSPSTNLNSAASRKSPATLMPSTASKRHISLSDGDFGKY